MREIKFRVWDIYKKVFIPENVYAIKNIWSAFWIMTENWENYNEWEVFYNNMQTISQYTWLKDKNGKEIYEKSIIDNDYEVNFIFPWYILKNIYNGDIITFQNYEWQIKITKEYSEL